MMRILLLLAALTGLSSCAFQSEHADLIVHNAKIYSVDDAFSIHEAMAIRDGKILAIGPEREILNKYTADRVIDARKKCVYPGFIDAHCHFLAYGYGLAEADLVGSTSMSDVYSRLAETNKKRVSGWLIGRGWDQNDWKKATAGNDMAADSAVVPFPDRDSLDILFPDTPVMLSRIDGHAVLVNGKALELAGITPDTQVAGGVVEVKNGRCTGILIDNAIKFVEKVLPSRTSVESVNALMAAQSRCFEVGLTSVHDAGLMRRDVEIIDSLQRASLLKMRIYVMLADDSANYAWFVPRGIDTSNASLVVRSFKFYADGALGSRGACLLSPYEDILQKFRRKEYGKLLSTEDYFRSRFAELYNSGFQVNTHAIGDSANRVILSLYGELLEGTNDKRWRIEHAQVVDERDISLFAQYCVIPSVQPTHATSDMPWAWERLGRGRLKRAYAYNELKNQLGLVALGTDFPVEGISPLATFYAAVFRKSGSGQPEGGFQSENALSREDALRGMTIWAAVAGFEDHRKGSLEPGKLADFVILDTDLMKCSESEVLQARVMYTALSGEIVYGQ